MNEQEIRMRCIEAAAKNPTPHTEGYAAGIVQTAEKFVEFITHGGRLQPATPVQEPLKVGDLF